MAFVPIRGREFILDVISRGKPIEPELVAEQGLEPEAAGELEEVGAANDRRDPADEQQPPALRSQQGLAGQSVYVRL